MRVAVAFAVAFGLAVPLALLTDGPPTRAFGLACVAVGSLSLLMAFGGSSPSRRMGTQDPWLASFFPDLTRVIGAQYARTRLSDSAIFVLVGVAVLAIGVALVDR